MAEVVALSELVFTVNGPVRVRFGEFYARLLPAREEWTPPDDSVVLPWAWLGLVHATFTIGRAQTSKRIIAKATTTMDPPTAIELDEMFGAMEVDMRRLIERHGIGFGYEIPWVITTNAEALT